MSVEDWLRWPTKSTDPAANAAIAVFLVLAAIMLVVVGGMFLLPVVLVLGIAKGVHWYANRPTPTDQLYAQAQQRTITANFPDPENSRRLSRSLPRRDPRRPARLQHLSRRWRTSPRRCTSRSISTIPCRRSPPPIPSRRAATATSLSPISARRPMRRARSKSSTTRSANAYLDFIAALPPMAMTTPEEFAKCDEIDAFATFPLLMCCPMSAAQSARTLYPFFREDVEAARPVQSELRRQLDRNFQEASGIQLAIAITPDQHPGHAARDRFRPISPARRWRRCSMPRSPSRSPTGSVTSTCTSSAAPGTAKRSSCSVSFSTTCNGPTRRR